MGRSRTQKYGEPKWTDVYLLSHVVRISVRYTRRDGYDEKSSVGKVSKAQKKWPRVTQRGVERHVLRLLPGSATFSHRPNNGFRVHHTRPLRVNQQDGSDVDCRAKTNTKQSKQNHTKPHLQQHHQPYASVTTSNWSGRRNPGTNEFHIPGYNQIQNLNIKKSIRVARGSL